MEDKKRKILLSAVKMVNAGVKSSLRDEPCCTGKMESDVYYPSLYLNSQEVPSLVGYEVDDKVVIVIKGKIVSHTMNESEGEERRDNFEIKIKEVGCINGNEKKEDEEEY